MSPRRSIGSAVRLYALIAVAAILAVLAAPSAYALEVDVIARLVYVVDGDTVRLVVVRACSERFTGLVGFEGKLRLADVNAPELGTPEGLRAKEALEALLAEKRVLYIDVDDLHVFDRYGRIVGVLLVEYNETTLLNVNEWLLEKGYAEPRDYPNEFTPHWSLYTPRSDALHACLEGLSRVQDTSGGAATLTLWATKTVTRTSTETVWKTTTVTVAACEATTPTRIATIAARARGAENDWRGCWTLLLIAVAAAAAAGYLAGARRW